MEIPPKTNTMHTIPKTNTMDTIPKTNTMHTIPKIKINIKEKTQNTQTINTKAQNKTSGV